MKIKVGDHVKVNGESKTVERLTKSEDGESILSATDGSVYNLWFDVVEAV